MAPQKTLKDLAAQVEKRFQLGATGFQLDDFHVCLEDEIGDIIDNPKEERLVILTEKLDYSKPAPAPNPASEEKYQDLVQQSSTQQKALQSKIDELQATNSNLKMKLADLREELGDAIRQKDAAEARAAKAEQRAARAEAQVAQAAVASVASPLSSTVGSVIRNPSPRESMQDANDNDPEPAKQTPVAADPEPEIEEKEEDAWAAVERRMKERNRKKKEKEMAARQPLKQSEPVEVDPEELEAQKASAAASIRERMNARLKDRKGPRLKLEPTKPRRSSAPQKDSPAIKKDTLKVADAMAQENEGDEEQGAQSEGEPSPRTKIANRMAARMKDRVGPRISLQPHVKQRDIETAERRRAKSELVAKKKADTTNAAQWAGATLSKKEANRIQRMALEIGDKLDISSHRTGILRFMGETEFAPGGIMFGLELVGGALGDHSGTVDGVQYFTCEPRRGVFITSKEIRKKQRKPKPKEPKKSVYRRRLERILKEFNPNRLKGLDALLDKNAGNEHLLYLKVCKKYYVSPEKEYHDDTEQS